MDGAIDPSVEQRSVELLREEAFAADFGQRTIGNLIATRRHGNQFDDDAGMHRPQTGGDVFGLPKRQRTLTRGDANA